MGRQIHFHMMPEDQSAFLKFVQEVDPVVVAFRDGEAAEIEPLTDTGSATNRTLCLWNRELQPKLDRKWIEDPGYYRVDGLKTSTLEFVPSLRSTWEGKDALVQGRLFGDFDKHLGKAAEFEEWYESIVRWIRKNYEKSPATSERLCRTGCVFHLSGWRVLTTQFRTPTDRAMVGGDW